MLQTAAAVANIPALAGLAVLVLAPQFILEGVFGGYYRAASGLLLVLAFGQCVNSFTGTCGLTLLMTGHERTSLGIHLASTLFLCLAGTYAVQRYGVLGLAVISAAALAMNNLAHWACAADSGRRLDSRRCHRGMGRG